MAKILSQAGVTLADIYDVEGSISGIDSLESRELPIVHEMGATVFSERYNASFRRLATGNLLQNVAFDVVITNLPVTITRLLALVVTSDNRGRIAQCTVSVRSPDDDQDIPIWNFAVGASEVARFQDDGAAVGAVDLLTPQPGSFFVPNMIGGSGQGPSMVQDIALRGLTTGFGAGNVFVNAIIYMAFPFVTGTRSQGLPIPSW